MKVDVLGTKYTIIETTPDKDDYLNNCDGYCDRSTKKIVIITADARNCELGDFEQYRKHCLRHEIIHAFMFESGLGHNFKKEEWGHDETTVDWLAIQFPKMLKAFRDVGCI